MSNDHPSSDSHEIETTLDSFLHSPATGATLKRRASPSFEGMQEDVSRKRIKEQLEPDSAMISTVNHQNDSDTSNLANDLEQELQCGCCSELAYRPVLVLPCQHFFCGSCCILWIRNGGTNCPACRGVSTIVTPFRPLQSVIDALIRSAPHKARTERERRQADEIYKAGTSMRLPLPREASPEPTIAPITDFARPCPHCLPDNQYGWRCPQPISDPHTDPDHAWALEDGLPPGHGQCGNCENILALGAPTSSKCDLCQVSFCGIGVHGRCLAVSFLSQHPQGLSDISDLIQSADVYESFDSNTVEVEIMLDYITAQRLTPTHIYREIVTYLQTQPRGFNPLIELDLFVDVHPVAAGPDPGPEAARSKICRACSAEVLIWGLKEWWVRERQKGFLEEDVTNRKDCPEGSDCNRQRDLAHAKEFNHIIVEHNALPQSIVAPAENAENVHNDHVPSNVLPEDGVVPNPVSSTESLADTDDNLNGTPSYDPPQSTNILPQMVILGLEPSLE